jgi:hypothetical protein
MSSKKSRQLVPKLINGKFFKKETNTSDRETCRSGFSTLNKNLDKDNKAQSVTFCNKQCKIPVPDPENQKHVANLNSGSGSRSGIPPVPFRPRDPGYVKSRSGSRIRIQDEYFESYFRELRNNFWV